MSLYSDRIINVLYVGSAGPLSVAPFQALCDAGYRPCAVAVDAGGLLPHRVLPVVAECGDALESLALTNNIPLVRLSRDAHTAADQLRRYAPDIVIVSCFARKLADTVRAVPRVGCFNLHPAMLPAYRGPSPIFWQFREGVSTMGITLHHMSAQLDAGDIVAQAEVAMPDGIALQQASHLLAEAAGRLLVEALSRRGSSAWCGRAQQEEKASYRGFPAPSDYAVSTRWPAQRLFNFMRATGGEGIVYPCKVNGQHFSLVEAITFQASGSAQLSVQGDAVTLPCRSGFVRARFLPEPV